MSEVEGSTVVSNTSIKEINSVFTSQEVLDILHPGWSEKKLENNDVFPFFMNRKLGISYCLQPFLTRTIPSYENLDPKYWNEFFPKICQFNLGVIPKNVPENWEITEMKYQRITFGHSMEEIEKTYSLNIKRIKKKQDIFSLDSDTSLSTFFTFMKKNNPFFCKMKKNLFARFQKLILYFDSNSMGELLCLKNEKREMVAMSYYVFDGNSVIDFKGSATREGKKTGAVAVLHLKAFERYHSNFKFYDFYGANSSRRAHFNRKFGSQHVSYYQFTRIDYHRFIKKIIKKIWSI